MWASFLGLIFAGTLFTQDELGWSPLQAGSSTIPIAVLSIVANAVLAPRVMTRLGPATTLAVGLLVMTVGLALVVRVPSNASFLLDLAPAYSLLGLGLGLAEVGAQVAAFTGVRDDEAGIAGGALETAREMGGALGVAEHARWVARSGWPFWRQRRSPERHRPTRTTASPWARHCSRWPAASSPAPCCGKQPARPQRMSHTRWQFPRTSRRRGTPHGIAAATQFLHHDVVINVPSLQLCEDIGGEVGLEPVPKS
jgi:hypothetical protein